MSYPMAWERLGPRSLAPSVPKSAESVLLRHTRDGQQAPSHPWSHSVGVQAALAVAQGVQAALEGAQAALEGAQGVQAALAGAQAALAAGTGPHVPQA